MRARWRLGCVTLLMQAGSLRLLAFIAQPRTCTLLPTGAASRGARSLNPRVSLETVAMAAPAAAARCVASSNGLQQHVPSRSWRSGAAAGGVRLGTLACPNSAALLPMWRAGTGVTMQRPQGQDCRELSTPPPPPLRLAGPLQPRRRLLSRAAGEDLAAAAAATTETPAGVAWDPDGVLPPASGGGHFARRARQKAAASGQQLAEAGGVRPIPAEHLAAGGLPAADASLYDRPALEVCCVLVR